MSGHDDHDFDEHAEERAAIYAALSPAQVEIHAAAMALVDGGWPVGLLCQVVVLDEKVLPLAAFFINAAVPAAVRHEHTPRIVGLLRQVADDLEEYNRAPDTVPDEWPDTAPPDHGD